MDIKTVPFTNLLKLELSSLAESVITVVEKHNPEELNINEVFELYLAQEPNIKLLKVRFGAHPITKELTPVRQMCFSYAQYVVYNMNRVMKTNANNLTSEMLRTNAVIQDYLYKLAQSKNEDVVIQRVTGLFTLIDRDEALEASCAEFNLSSDLDNLRSAFSTLKELLMQRTKNISERSKAKRSDLQAPIVKAMKALFMQIEIEAMKDSELDYAPLINELNETIVKVKNQVNRRLLYNQRKKAERLEKVGSNNESTSPEIDSTPMIKTMSGETDMGNGFKDGFDEQLDQKKTVASSVKNLQLPSSDKEA